MKMKPIPGFPDYEITNDGQVWSTSRRGIDGRRVRGKWLRPGHDGHGYYRVTLYRDGKPYERKVHRLVLETFIGPCPPGMEACHNNGNPADNRVENLRWDSHSANQLDAVRHGTSPGFQTRGEAHGRAKLTEQQVRQIREEYNTGQFFQWEIAERHGIARPTVGCIIRGETWKHLRAATTPIVPVAA